MNRFKALASRKMTSLSAAVVLALLSLATGIGCGLYVLITNYILDVRVRNSVPAVLKAATQERDHLVAAIEAYHSHFGFYPPDHVLTDQPLRIDPVTNQLFYELIGTIYSPVNAAFFTDGVEPMRKGTAKAYFNIEAFKNFSTDKHSLKQFLSRDSVALREIHDGPDVMVLVPNVVANAQGVAYSVLSQWEVSSWCYVSRAPTNNPGKFDLWAELNAGPAKLTINNWQKAEYSTAKK